MKWCFFFSYIWINVVNINSEIRWKKSFSIHFKTRETNLNFTGCQMPHLMIALILYINLLNLSWIKMSIFEEYGAFVRSILNCLHYENTSVQQYWLFYHQKNEKFQIKNSDIFHISAQNIDCGYSLEPPRRGGSNKYTQSMFWAEIRKIMYTPVNPSFTI